jgi:UDP:flavonoid glycosyltransferase YjiC (YdhE family)
VFNPFEASHRVGLFAKERTRTTNRIRIVIFTVGTEGDARPYAALAQGLADAGHDVVVATSREFEGFVRAHGLGFAPLTADFLEMMRRSKAVIDRRSQIAMVRTLMSETRRMAESWADESLAAAAGADLVIGSGNVSLIGASVAEKLGIPYVRSQLQPFDPSRALPPVLFRPPAVPLPGAINLALYRVLRVIAWRMMQRAVNGVRHDLGLRPYPWTGPWALSYGAGGRILYGFSAQVVPRQPEWPERIAMPGYFILKEAERYTPPLALEQFLSDGPAPIYIGFGSMVSSKARDLARVVVEAVRLSGHRALVGTGWAGLGDDLDCSDDMLVVGSVPHDWLFPRVALAVHHCGAGTTAAAVRAGIPTVPVPFVGDQFFWAWQLGRLGVATPSLDRRRLTAAQLAEAIRLAGKPKMIERAAALGERVRAEDGVAAAIRQLERWGLLPEVKPAQSKGGPTRIGSTTPAT